jgi:hypothetical protein
MRHVADVRTLYNAVEADPAVKDASPVDAARQSYYDREGETHG